MKSRNKIYKIESHTARICSSKSSSKKEKFKRNITQLVTDSI